MEKITRLSAEQREDLVAFLDHELDDPTAQQIEQVLSRSPVARHEVEMLTRTWEMLDLLPRPEVSEDFTERTLSTIRLDEVREPVVGEAARQWMRTARRWLIAAACLAGLVAAAVVGFLITNRWIPNQTEGLVEDYPVIRQLDVYRDTRDIEFLKLLQERNLLRNETEPDDR